MSAIRVVRRPEGNYDRICKEVVFTAMMRSNVAGVADFEKLESLLITKYPMERSGAPTDMANAVLFLASDQASCVNGAVGRIASGGR